jgi:phosphoribosyl 1,2-cyclic phosphodiesterase
VAVLTDLGHVPCEALPHLRDLELLVLEANHDLEMLWSGPYPPRLKRRIAGSLGHLSNVAAGEAVASTGDRAPGELWLAHLSQTNNTPARAVEQDGGVLRAHGLGRLRPKPIPRRGRGLRWTAPAARQLALF